MIRKYIDQDNFADLAIFPEWNQKDLIAFTHIEKTAGTTFIEVLKQIFGLGFIEARPVEKYSGRLRDQKIGAKDMKVYLRMNPYLKCLSGHAVYPTELGESLGDRTVRYITILRNPINRYVSHYSYVCKNRAKDIPFEEFLELDQFQNFQTKKIAGADDLQAAMDILETRFLAVGLLEYFDEFLLTLRNKLMHGFGRAIPLCNLQYTRENAARSRTTAEELTEKYYDRIAENNSLDIDLYNFVRREIVIPELASGSEQIYHDITFFRECNIRGGFPKKEDGWRGVFRSIYFDGFPGLLRLARGLPPKGSY